MSCSTEEVHFSYSDEGMLLYNPSIGMGRHTRRGGAALLRNTDINWAMMLHAEQRLKIHSPLA
ncbi:hypothetical protein [Zhongshania sp.]|uniref:hypothetical protein n=1 Tax=Zhongshania sp. TaxID=1971902 RepID=UPI003565BB44